MKKCHLICQCICCFLFITGCASRSERLAAEYEKVSQHADAVQNELKATVNAQNSADNLVKAQQELNKQLEKLSNIREENDDNGYFVATSVDDSATPQEISQQLATNYELLSNKMDELRKEKGRITEEQARD